MAPRYTIAVLRQHSSPLLLKEPCPEHLECLGLVLVLTALILHGHNQARGQMCDAHSAVGGVHMLPASTTGTVCVNAQVLVSDGNINLHIVSTYNSRSTYICDWLHETHWNRQTCV